MGEVVSLNQPYWKSFRLLDGKQRWFYTDESSRIRDIIIKILSALAFLKDMKRKNITQNQFLK